MDDELKDKLQMLPNAIKPYLCEMVDCEYKGRQSIICEVYAREVKNEHQTWCSIWFEIEPLRMHVFMTKYGGSK